MGILPMSTTGVPPVKTGPRWPCDSWAGRPCYEGVVMVWAYILGGITTVGLLIYLLIALLKPEKF